MNYAGHHVISTTTVPTTTTSPLAVGFLWSDPSDNSLKICTSISPVTFAAVGGGTVTDANVSFSDITTGDASSTKHGFMPKLPWTLDAGTAAASAPFTFQQTWNGGAVSFEEVVINATETAAGANSKMLVCKRGNVEQFSVRRDGQVACQLISCASLTQSATFQSNVGGYYGISDGTDYTHLRRVASAGFKVTDSAGTTYRSMESLYQRWGSGTPEGAVSAPVGAIFHRTDGGALTSFYVKESGSGNTGWVSK